MRGFLSAMIISFVLVQAVFFFVRNSKSQPANIAAGFIVTNDVLDSDSLHTYTIECAGGGYTSFKIKAGYAAYRVGEYLELVSADSIK
jgi:hypothetical protein